MRWSQSDPSQNEDIKQFCENKKNRRVIGEQRNERANQQDNYNTIFSTFVSLTPGRT
jgi:hypothetical protein